jgi:multicomponent Na+:H+ antiporter subunit E
VNAFLLNVLLAFAWAAVWGNISPDTLLAGFALGYGALYLVRPLLGETTTYHLRLWRTVEFTGFYLWEVLVSSIRVTAHVLAPRFRMVPGIVAIPMEAETDEEITILANLVSLTPGTLSLDVSADRKILYVHAMDLGEGGADALRKDIRERLERRVLALLR